MVSTPELPEPTPVTVDAAWEALSALRADGRGDWILAVRYDPGRDTMGPLPAKPVTGLFNGFDWDDGKVLLTTATPLGPGGEELIRLREQLRKAQAQVFQLQRDLRAATGRDNR